MVLIVYLYGKKHPLCLHGDEIKLLKIDWSIVSTLIGKGVPMALQMTVLSLSMVLMISLVNSYGVDTAAAYGAAVQLWNYIQMPSFAIGMAVSSMAAQNIGAQKWDRIVIITRMGVIFQLALTGTMVLLVDVFCRSALGLFLPAGSVAIDIGVHLNGIVTWSFVFFGISMVLFGVVRGEWRGGRAAHHAGHQSAGPAVSGGVGAARPVPMPMPFGGVFRPHRSWPC